MSTYKTDRTGISRRDFARRAAAAAAAATCLPGDLLAVPLPACPHADGAETDITPEMQAEIDAKVEAILRKYGDRLSDAQKTDIRRLVAEGQKPLARLRAYALENSDQPGNVMKIYPDASAARRAPSSSERPPHAE